MKGKITHLKRKETVLSVLQEIRDLMREERSSHVAIQPPTNVDKFLSETFAEWYGSNTAKIQKLAGIPDFAAIKDSAHSSKFGEYFDNGQAFNIEKVVIKDLPEMNGKQIWKVAEYVHKKFGKDYLIPGLTALKGFWGKKGDSPVAMRLSAWQCNFFFGSLVRDKDGRWSVPSAEWSGSSFGRCANWLAHSWNSDDRVVLLEI
jgi:hypothetical protein